jgi:hypothetical protein
MTKEGTAGNRNHVASMIPQKAEIVRRLESSGSRNVATATYNMRTTIHHMKKWTDQLLFMASCKSMNNLFKQQTLKQPKSVQLDKVSCTWFSAMCCKVYDKVYDK